MFRPCLLRPRLLGSVVAVTAAVLASLGATPIASATDPAERPAQPVTFTPAAGPVHQVTHLGQPWPGVDDFDCRPTADKPRPEGAGGGTPPCYS